MGQSMTGVDFLEILTDQMIESMDSAYHDIDECNDILEHYGTPRHSGRYPYGSGDRPYQRLEGGSSKKAQRAYNKQVKKLNKQKAKEKEEAEKKAESERKEKEAAEKARVRNLRDPRKLREHQYEYSADEVNEALKRFEWDKKLYEFDTAKMQRGAEYMQTFLKYATSAVGIYNVGANIYNSIQNREDAVLPLISTGSGQQKKKEYPKKPEKPGKDKKKS